MEALAGGILRVLEGKEEAKEFDVVPTGYESVEAFYANLKTKDKEI